MAKSFALIPGGEMISLIPTPMLTTSSFRPWVIAIPTRLWSYEVWYPIIDRARLAAATGLSFSTLWIYKGKNERYDDSPTSGPLRTETKRNGYAPARSNVSRPRSCCLAILNVGHGGGAS